jgi:phage N-6-adenine-methyltransferase
MHPQNQEEIPVHSLETYCGKRSYPEGNRFPKSGTWGNGWFSVQPALDCPTIESDCLSLPTPTALSSRNSRPPGQNKLEVKLKQLGLIQRGEVANPELLETMFGLPMGYSSPVELTRETPLPADDAKHSEIPSAENVRSQPLEESCTSIPYAKESDGKYSSKGKGKNLKSNSQSPISDNPKSKPSDCWYTPPHIIELVLQVLGQIDLDPCADDGKHIPASQHFTAADDGLNQDWHGHVYMNPPYSCPGVWMAKLQAEIESGRVSSAIALVPAATDTNWLSPVLKQQPVCFWKGRIKFLDADYKPKAAARQSHVLVYWGENWEKFREVFDGYGFVSVPTVLMVNSTVSTGESKPTTEAVLMVNDSTVSTQVEEPEETVLTVNGSTVSTKRRSRGKGTGRIQWRTITKKNGKQYQQAWYDWQLHVGEKVISKSTYIPKHLLTQVQELNAEKAPVREILQVLGVMV